MYMAIAVESPKHPENKTHYKVWYLRMNQQGHVISIGVKTREEVVQHIFENYRQTGCSNWRAFKKDREESSPIEILDFISMNINENTHFGNLPTISEFQNVLNALSMNFELRATA